MKTKELIRALQELDPSGETEVVAGGAPIFFAEALPAYYDGALQSLIQDKSRTDYNITGYKFSDQGNKIMLRLMDLESVLWEDPNATIDFDDLASVILRGSWRETIAKIKKDIELSGTLF